MRLFAYLMVTLALHVLAGCGSGGGSKGTSTPPPPPPPPETFITLTVTDPVGQLTDPAWRPAVELGDAGTWKVVFVRDHTLRFQSKLPFHDDPSWGHHLSRWRVTEDSPLPGDYTVDVIMTAPAGSGIPDTDLTWTMTPPVGSG